MARRDKIQMPAVPQRLHRAQPAYTRWTMISKQYVAGGFFVLGSYLAMYKMVLPALAALVMAAIIWRVKDKPSSPESS